jgi:phosphoglycolate phosphatase
MLESLGKDTYSQKTIDFWVGNGAPTLVKRALSGSREVDESISYELFSKALDIFLDYYSKNLIVHTKLYPKVKKTLDELQKRDYTFALVTNKPYSFVEPMLKKLELESYFKLFIGGDSLDKRKPDPKPLFHTCKKLGFEIENSIMIGDSKNDIIAANNANMDSIALTYGYNYGEDVKKFNPTFVYDNFSDILEVL